MMKEISGWSLVPVRVMVTVSTGAIAPESMALKERVRVSSVA